jgi:hypothetical protein
MTDDKKQEITNEGKPKYQPPQVLPLGGLSTGLGYCASGSTDALSCDSGPVAETRCITGTNAEGTCNTGGSGLTL